MAADNKDLLGRVAIVTGASRGIGRAIALALAARGATLVVTARSKSLLDELASEIRGQGGQAVPVVGDVGDAKDVRRVVQVATRDFDRVDIMVNNAGVGVLAPVTEITDDDFSSMMNSNFVGTFLYSREVVPIMTRQGGGMIVNIASISGLKGFANATVYCASKFATIGFARALDLEVREKNIKVVSICPAGVDTDWAIGSGKVRTPGLLSPDTVADAVIYAVTQPENCRVPEIILYPMSEEGHQ